MRDAFPNPYSLQDAENFLSRVMKANQRTVFAIATEFEAIGSIGLMFGKDVHRFTGEMGYWLAEPYTTNPASARVLEKAGFICEGILRSNVFKEGKIKTSGEKCSSKFVA